MLVCISGTPGCGKTTVSRILSEITGFGLVDIKGFALAHGLITGRDRKRKSDIVDTRRLWAESKKLKGNLILEGHLAHFAKCDICIILRTNPEELRARLEKKGWNAGKIAENIEAEILDICLSEAVEEQGLEKVFEVDTTGKLPKDIAGEICALVLGKNRSKYKPGKIDWTGYIKYKELRIKAQKTNKSSYKTL